jgi:hypothetical protein
MKMNYDETQQEIERLAGDISDCDEVKEEEIWL